MAKNKKTEELEDLNENERHLLGHHLATMGFDELDAYRTWCEQQGLSRRLVKTRHQRRKERDLRSAERSQTAIARLKSRRRAPVELVDAVLAGSVEREELTREYQIVHDLVPSLGRRQQSREVFRRLIHVANDRTKLIATTPVIRDYANDAHNTMIGGLASLATHHQAWIRDLEEWKPKSKSAQRQFSDLARFLLAEYPIPAFMDSVWFKHSRSQNWFIHVGRGKNIRKAERLLIPLTTRMAHAFMQAPADYTVEHAFRWAQVHALGGNRRMVEAIRATRLGSSFREDAFWSSVVRFFVRNPLLDTTHYGPIVDFIQHQKFESAEVFIRPGVVETRPPPHPGLSMKGRDPAGLLRQVEAWHSQLGRERRHLGQVWQSTGIRPLEWVEGSERKANRKRWTIQELLSAHALAEEGGAMRHCVATYAGSCASGRSSIWSMQREDAGAQERVLTIALEPKSKRLTEARGKMNRAPTQKSMEILRRWATQEGLTIPVYIEL